MVKVSMKVLSVIAIALQFVALFISIVIVCNPQPVYQILGAPEDVFGITVVPFVTLISLAIPLLWFGGGAAFVLFTQQVSVVGKIAVIISIVMYCISNLALNYVSVWENIIVGRSGTYRLAALSTIRSAISWVTGPLTTAAFVLVVLVAGGYIWQKNARV